LIPDDKTIADFRKDNGSAIRKVCAQFVALCRDLGLLSKANTQTDDPATPRRVSQMNVTGDNGKTIGSD